jgi:hypothetical protein
MASRLIATQATAANLAAATPLAAELCMTTDTKKMFLGDGTTLGGIAVNPDASETVAGLAERATDAEVRTGTDTTRYISPNQYRLGMLYGGAKVAWVDNQNGSDANGAVNRFDRPYQTINAALAAVGIGGWAIARSGAHGSFATTAAGQTIFSLGYCIIDGNPISVNHLETKILGGFEFQSAVSSCIIVANGASLTIDNASVFCENGPALTINGTGAVVATNTRFWTDSGGEAVQINSGSVSFKAANCRFTGTEAKSIDTAAPVTVTLANCVAAAALDAAVTNNGNALVVDADFDF